LGAAPRPRERPPRRRDVAHALAAKGDRARLRLASAALVLLLLPTERRGGRLAPAAARIWPTGPQPPRPSRSRRRSVWCPADRTTFHPLPGRCVPSSPRTPR